MATHYRAEKVQKFIDKLQDRVEGFDLIGEFATPEQKMISRIMKEDTQIILDAMKKHFNKEEEK